MKENMKVVHTLALSEEIVVVALAPVMDLLAVGTRKSVTVFRTTTLAPLLSVSCKVPSADVTCVAWSPSCRFITVGFTNSAVALVHVESGDILRYFFCSVEESSGSRKGSDEDSAMFLSSSGIPLTAHPLSLQGAIWGCAWVKVAAHIQGGELLNTSECLQMTIAADASALVSLVCDEAATGHHSALIVVNTVGDVAVIAGGLVQIWGSRIDIRPAATLPLYHPANEILVSPNPDTMSVIRGGNSVLLSCDFTSVVKRLSSEEVLLRALVCEFSYAASESFASICEEWAAVVSSLLTAINATSAHNLKLLQSLLTAAIAAANLSPVDVVHFFRSVDVPALVAAAEKLRTGFQTLSNRVFVECFNSLERALATTRKLSDTELSKFLFSKKEECSAFLKKLTFEAHNGMLLAGWAFLNSQKTGNGADIVAPKPLGEPLLASSYSCIFDFVTTTAWLYFSHQQQQKDGKQSSATSSPHLKSGYFDSFDAFRKEILLRGEARGYQTVVVQAPPPLLSATSMFVENENGKILFCVVTKSEGGVTSVAEVAPTLVSPPPLPTCFSSSSTTTPLNAVDVAHEIATATALKVVKMPSKEAYLLLLLQQKNQSCFSAIIASSKDGSISVVAADEEEEEEGGGGGGEGASHSDKLDILGLTATATAPLRVSVSEQRGFFVLAAGQRFAVVTMDEY